MSKETIGIIFYATIILFGMIMIIAEIYNSIKRKKKINKILENKFEKRCYNCEYLERDIFGDTLCRSGKRVTIGDVCKAFEYKDSCVKKAEFIVDHELEEDVNG